MDLIFRIFIRSDDRVSFLLNSLSPPLSPSPSFSPSDSDSTPNEWEMSFWCYVFPPEFEESMREKQGFVLSFGGAAPKRRGMGSREKEGRDGREREGGEEKSKEVGREGEGGGETSEILCIDISRRVPFLRVRSDDICPLPWRIWIRISLSLSISHSHAHSLSRSSSFCRVLRVSVYGGEGEREYFEKLFSTPLVCPLPPPLLPVSLSPLLRQP